MMLLSFIAGVCCGLIPGIAYARSEVRKAKADESAWRTILVARHQAESAAVRAARMAGC
jgi:hypothetical protein